MGTHRKTPGGGGGGGEGAPNLPNNGHINTECLNGASMHIQGLRP